MNTYIKQRVADIGSPNFTGTVIEAGPYVSEVRWDNKTERGATQYVPNNMLIVVHGTNLQERELT